MAADISPTTRTNKKVIDGYSGENAAKQMAWHLETQTSVEVEVTTTITPFGENAKRTLDYPTIVEHYIETASGQRYLDFRGMKSGAVESRSAHYGDRGKFTDLNYHPHATENQDSIYLTNHFWMEDGSDRRQIPMPLLFFYVGHKPLHAALPKAQYLGTGECLNRECEIFLFTQVRWFVPQDQVFYLDKKTSIPLKVETFRDESSRQKKQSMGVWAAKSLDFVQGYYLPLKSTLIQLGQDGNPVNTWDFEVNKVKFNETYPDSTFHPILEPGVAVLDSVTNKAYHTPGVMAPPVASPPSVPVPGQVVQASPPRDWSTTLSGGSLILAMALVIVGGFAWWRRR